MNFASVITNKTRRRKNSLKSRKISSNRIKSTRIDNVENDTVENDNVENDTIENNNIENDNIKNDNINDNYEITELSSNKMIESLVMYICKKHTSKDNMVIIGSSALWFLQNMNNMNMNCFNYFNSSLRNKITGIETEYMRDLDILLSLSKYRELTRELSIYGTVKIITSTSMYNNNNLSSRNIMHIVKITFTSKGDGLLSYLFTDDIVLDIDFVIYDNKVYDTVMDVYKNWPISHISRNYIVWYEGTNFMWDTMVSNDKVLDLTKQCTLKNLIESFKTQIYENSVITKSGDYIVNDVSNKIFCINKRRFFQKHNILNSVLSGNNKKLLKTYKIKCDTVKNLLRNNKFSNLLKTSIVEDPCSICYETLNTPLTKLHITKCGHIFHINCLLSHLIKYIFYIFNNISGIISSDNDQYIYSKACPYCRESLIDLSDMSHSVCMNIVLNERDIQYNPNDFFNIISLISR
jgi:hypothetical protein